METTGHRSDTHARKRRVADFNARCEGVLQIFLFKNRLVRANFGEIAKQIFALRHEIIILWRKAYKIGKFYCQDCFTEIKYKYKLDNFVSC